MSMEQTLAMVKPIAVAKGYTGLIIDQIEKAGFKIKKLKHTSMTRSEAQNFYWAHASQPFYQDLCRYIASGPIVVVVLEKENAIAHFRNLVGSTDPKEASAGTLRRQFGTSINENAIHGSDSQETAKSEIQFFFGAQKCCRCRCQ